MIEIRLSDRVRIAESDDCSAILTATVLSRTNTVQATAFVSPVLSA